MIRGGGVSSKFLLTVALRDCMRRVLDDSVTRHLVEVDDIATSLVEMQRAVGQYVEVVRVC